MEDNNDVEQGSYTIKNVYVVQNRDNLYNKMNGTLKFYTKNETMCINWTESSTQINLYDFDGVNNDLLTDWGIVDNYTDNNSDKNSYERSISDLKTITTSNTLTLKSGSMPFMNFLFDNYSDFPTLYFQSGQIQIKNVLQYLQRYVWLVKTPSKKDVYIVHDYSSIIGTYPYNPKKNDFLLNISLNVFNHISKVKNFVNKNIFPIDGLLNQYSPQAPSEFEELERTPSKNSINENNPTIDIYDGFLKKFNCDPLFWQEECRNEKPIDLMELQSLFNNLGQFVDYDLFLDHVSKRGLDESARCLAWKFLLKVYPPSSTSEERTLIDENNRKEYSIYKNQWQSITPQQEKRFNEFVVRKTNIHKDVIRTDRSHSFYADPKTQSSSLLNNILMSYCMYNFDLGYVQGMNDILSVILYAIKDEVDTFWCFTNLMEMIECRFLLEQGHIKVLFAKLACLIMFLCPSFYKFMAEKSSNDMAFSFRWLLLDFKREFSLEDTLKLWEIMWSQKLTKNYSVFMAASIIEYQSVILVKKDLDFDEILKHFNDLAMTIDLNVLLARTNYIIKQVQNMDQSEIPDYLRDII